MIQLARAAALPLVVTLTVASGSARAAPAHTVSGLLRVKGTGQLHVHLHDGVSFAGQGPGRKTLILELPGGDEAVEVPFSFADVAPGEYAIRCFQDRNGNGRLDMGLLGPREPWGVSGPRRLRPPRFEELRFTVAGDVAGIVIPVE
jgi:uncharacterized protein (DUF2141 family)